MSIKKSMSIWIKSILVNIIFSPKTYTDCVYQARGDETSATNTPLQDLLDEKSDSDHDHSDTYITNTNYNELLSMVSAGKTNIADTFTHYKISTLSRDSFNEISNLLIKLKSNIEGDISSYSDITSSEMGISNTDSDALVLNGITYLNKDNTIHTGTYTGDPITPQDVTEKNIEFVIPSGKFVGVGITGSCDTCATACNAACSKLCGSACGGTCVRDCGASLSGVTVVG